MNQRLDKRLMMLKLKFYSHMKLAIIIKLNKSLNIFYWLSISLPFSTLNANKDDDAQFVPKHKIYCSFFIASFIQWLQAIRSKLNAKMLSKTNQLMNANRRFPSIIGESQIIWRTRTGWRKATVKVSSTFIRFFS